MKLTCYRRSNQLLQVNQRFFFFFKQQLFSCNDIGRSERSGILFIFIYLMISLQNENLLTSEHKQVRESPDYSSHGNGVPNRPPLLRQVCPCRCRKKVHLLLSWATQKLDAARRDAAASCCLWPQSLGKSVLCVSHFSV